MANKHMKRCSTGNISKKCKLKQLRYHYTPIRMANISKQTSPNAGGDMEQWKLLFTAGGNAECSSHFGSNLGSFLQN